MKRVKGTSDVYEKTVPSFTNAGNKVGHLTRKSRGMNMLLMPHRLTIQGTQLPKINICQLAQHWFCMMQRQVYVLQDIQSHISNTNTFLHYDALTNLRRFGVLAYLPALNFICSCCEEVDELDCSEPCCDNFVYGTLGSHLCTDQHVSTPGSITPAYRADALQCFAI